MTGIVGVNTFLGRSKDHGGGASISSTTSTEVRVSVDFVDMTRRSFSKPSSSFHLGTLIAVNWEKLT